MNNIDQFFRNSQYNIIRILLSINGVWPFDTLRKRYAIHFAIALVLGSGFTFQVLGVIEIWRDTFELIDSLPLLVFSQLAVLKIICAVYKLPKIKLLLTKMQEYCISPKSDEEIKIQNLHSRYGRNFGYFYTGIIMAHSGCYVLMTLVIKLIHMQSHKDDAQSNKEQNAQLELPYRVNYMVDRDTYYAPIFIHTATCGVSYTLIIVTFDVLYLTLVEHCCGLFAALRYRLENAFELAKNSDNLNKDKSYLNIIYSIRRHAEAIQFVAILESIYSLPLFIHIGCFVLIISVVGYQIITTARNVNQVLKHMSYLNAVLINLFFENWQGQKIIDSSEKVFESAYNAEWYNMPIKARKLLVMIMMRNKKPTIFTVGNIIILSYVTFTSVLRTSSSYFMLLRSTM